MNSVHVCSSRNTYTGGGDGVGGVAVGEVAVGGVAVGEVAVGRVAVGEVAVGRVAVGEVAVGDTIDTVMNNVSAFSCTVCKHEGRLQGV